MVGFHIDYAYDKVGNVRHMYAEYHWLDAQGYPSTEPEIDDYWYKYDSMNRFVTTKGQFTGSAGSGAIDRGMKGTDISYDASGRRITTTRTAESIEGDEYYSYPVYASQKETYTYSDDGYLSVTSIATGDYGTSLTPASVSGPGTDRAVYSRDAMGRVIDYGEYNVTGYNGTNTSLNRVYNRQASYDNKSNVTSDIVTSVRSDGIWVNSTSYYYKAAETYAGSGQWQGVISGGVYMGGVVTRSTTGITKDGYTQTDDQLCSKVAVLSD